MSIEQRYAAFHARNPHVFRQLESLATIAKSQGRKRVGIGHLVEVVRWNHGITTRGETFKINNNFRALYVRDLIAKNPDFASLFETRKRRNEQPAVAAPKSNVDNYLGEAHD